MKQELLGRVHRELLDVLNSINQDEIHDDGHDFHKLLKDVEKALAHPEQEPVCPECKAGVLYECVACSSNNYPPKEST
jgi:hypothetical protein